MLTFEQWRSRVRVANDCGEIYYVYTGGFEVLTVPKESDTELWYEFSDLNSSGFSSFADNLYELLKDIYKYCYVPLIRKTEEAINE